MPGGRPRKKIDPEQVRKLAEKQWSNEQIAAFIGADRRTLERRFSQILHDARHSGRAKLVDQLWVRILAGSDRALIHALDRFLGSVPKKIEITREQAIEFLENELEREGTNSADPSKSEESK